MLTQQFRRALPVSYQNLRKQNYLPLFRHLGNTKLIYLGLLSLQTSSSFHCARGYSGIVTELHNLAHVIIADKRTHTNTQTRERKAILGPAGRARSVRPAGKKICSEVLLYTALMSHTCHSFSVFITNKTDRIARDHC